MIELIKNRLSVPAAQLEEPAPDERQIRQILQAAVSVPDHGALVPYRFITISGQARQKLSEVFVRAYKQRHPHASDEQIHKQANKPLRAPLILVVVASLTENAGIPLNEQRSTASALTMQIMLAANALGFDNIWLTGDHATDWLVKEALGLKMNEEITAFVYLGTAKQKPAKKARPGVEPLISQWQQPLQMESRF